MLRAGKNDPNKPLIVMGLTDENIRRLKNDMPIKAAIRSFGVDLPGEIVVFWGPAHEAMAERFRGAGLIGEKTEVFTDARMSAEELIIKEEKKILIATVGLPRSGKTTWAQSQAWPIVCPDSIRLALHGQRYAQQAEPFVWAIAKLMVRSLFDAGHKIVILDATNSTRARRDEWLLPLEWSLYFKVIDTPPDVCIERARAEGDEAIIPTIERMAAQHLPLRSDEQVWP